MGFLTLADFRAELTGVAGDRPTVVARRDAWINLGYFDVAGAVDFAELDGAVDFNTAAADNQYDVPAGVLTTISLRDQVAKRLIRKVSVTEVMRQDQSEVGPPTIWARHGASIYVHPTPLDIRALRLLYRGEPAALADAGDETILPRTWDAAILMLAISHGLFSLNEDARAMSWFNRGVGYMRSRLIEGTVTMPQSPAGGQ